jgi:hypothetical protein
MMKPVRWAVAVLVAVALAGCGGGAEPPPDFNAFARSLDVYQGFNFKKDKQAPVGFLKSIRIGDVELARDYTTLRDPEMPDRALPFPVAGVLSFSLWDMGAADAMYFSAQVSNANKQKLSSALLGTGENTAVTFEVVIYQYDPLQKKYFKSFFFDAPLSGAVEVNGEETNLTVADDPSSEVQSPVNYTLQVGITPAARAQFVNMATGSGKVVSKPWGVATGG